MDLLDLHIHGAFGVDVLTAGARELDRLAEGLRARGTGSFLPTLLPLALDELEQSVERLGAWLQSRSARDGRGALPLGLHFEGPFVSPARAGALPPDRFLNGNDPARVKRFFDLIADLPGRHMVTLAPEIPGGLELIAEFRRRGFLVSIGHTDAAFATLEQALDAGARHMTHFCNAMRPLDHREPGPIDFGLLQDDVSIDVIADGHHLSPQILKLIVATKPADRLVLISDAMPAVGQADGEYRIWGQSITLRNGTARNAAGNLAGSTALLADCVAHLTALGIPAERARAAASSIPRRLLESAV